MTQKRVEVQDLTSKRVERSKGHRTLENRMQKATAFKDRALHCILEYHSGGIDSKAFSLGGLAPGFVIRRYREKALRSKGVCLHPRSAESYLALEHLQPPIQRRIPPESTYQDWPLGRLADAEPIRVCVFPNMHVIGQGVSLGAQAHTVATDTSEATMHVVPPGKADAPSQLQKESRIKQ
ncbi:uncharacterized protein K444DRAFT_694546 [Hyaloscypha bicolor E]|uniref:Uncharacterized protein n=1 Tax=Hyaloscypha bicolor E TaxID=1095630 RepID=A0A2J6SZ37_9HELO|nr:uncharacterized protein K444DRAFT_694546 [Hyaloscypha bicolor E]PMD56037.1 hypothetical protein K444DRAFT_694546 [Hyaloscypha bicolor E]